LSAKFCEQRCESAEGVGGVGVMGAGLAGKRNGNRNPRQTLAIIIITIGSAMNIIIIIIGLRRFVKVVRSGQSKKRLTKMATNFSMLLSVAPYQYVLLCVVVEAFLGICFFFFYFFFGWLGKSYRQSQKQQKIASNVLNRIINRNGGKTTSNQTTETEIEIATQIGMN